MERGVRVEIPSRHPQQQAIGLDARPGHGVVLRTR
jgi:hypothetical protein